MLFPIHDSFFRRDSRASPSSFRWIMAKGKQKFSGLLSYLEQRKRKDFRHFFLLFFLLSSLFSVYNLVLLKAYQLKRKVVLIYYTMLISRFLPGQHIFKAMDLFETYNQLLDHGY